MMNTFMNYFSSNNINRVQKQGKIRLTAKILQKDKQFMEVHDNLLKALGQYIRAPKQKQIQYRAKLINQTNVSQYFLEALQDDNQMEYQFILSKNANTILKQLKNVPDKNNFGNKVLQIYKRCLIDQQLNQMQYTKDLRIEATIQQKQAILLSLVEGISKVREKNQKQHNFYQKQLEEGKDINIQRQYNEFSNGSKDQENQINKSSQKNVNKEQVEKTILKKQNQQLQFKNLQNRFFKQNNKQIRDYCHINVQKLKLYIRKSQISRIKGNFIIDFSDKYQNIHDCYYRIIDADQISIQQSVPQITTFLQIYPNLKGLIYMINDKLYINQNCKLVGDYKINQSKKLHYILNNATYYLVEKTLKETKKDQDPTFQKNYPHISQYALLNFQHIHPDNCIIRKNNLLYVFQKHIKCILKPYKVDKNKFVNQNKFKNYYLIVDH